MNEAGFGPVVTISASYGAGGSVIAPRLSEVLGLPFIDRLLSPEATVAAGRSQEGLVAGEQEASPTGRILSYFARAAHVGSVMAPEVVPPEPLMDDEAIKQRAEEPLRPVRQGAPAVILGRAAAAVLRDRPRTYHLRLDGPVDRRIAWAAPYEGLTLEAAKKRQDETDRARTQFVKRLYRLDPTGTGLYHMVLDPTVLGIDGAVKVITAALELFFGELPSGS